MNIFKTKDAKNAFNIGAVCVLGYVACYFAKNLLGVVSPYMIEEGFYDIRYIGLLSTANMLFYAVGQLVNGIIGDRIQAKFMIGFGLTFSGICYMVMAFSDVRMLITAVYSLSGFFLSMLYAPMMKVIAENTRPTYTIRCSLGLNKSLFDFYSLWEELSNENFKLAEFREFKNDSSNYDKKLIETLTE